MSNPTKSKEYSKKIVLWTGILFFLVIVCSLVFSYLGIDTSLFVYLIPSTGGIFGASIIFYLNKAKLENALKIKISFYRFKINIAKLLPEEHMEELNREFDTLEDALNSKVNRTIEESIDEDISISSL